MPRPHRAVKAKFRIPGPGAVDLHFHGAFGIDLMRAHAPELDRLSRRLWKKGVAGFLATTLSASREELLPAVARLGEWIRRGNHPGAIPLGIHLEGPYLSPRAAGAHPPGVIRPVRLEELQELWETSFETLRLITLAPEAQIPSELKRVIAWAKRHGVRLSLGHSHATQAQARQAFQQGFSGVTHAWNALRFHHRDPGVLGAALGRPGLHIEVIIDGFHIDPTLIGWVRTLHPQGTCFVSDCAPAAELPSGARCTFGRLEIAHKDGASRLPDGTLAGGGMLLSTAFCHWLRGESRATGIAADRLLRQTLRHLARDPLKALGLSAKALKHRQVHWEIMPSGRLRCVPERV